LIFFQFCFIHDKKIQITNATKQKLNFKRQLFQHFDVLLR